MVLQTLWQKPLNFWEKNFTKTEAGIELMDDADDVDLEYKRYWDMMRHKENRTDKQFIKIIVISLFLLRVTR